MRSKSVPSGKSFVLVRVTFLMADMSASSTMARAALKMAIQR